MIEIHRQRGLVATVDLVGEEAQVGWAEDQVTREFIEDFVCWDTGKRYTIADGEAWMARLPGNLRGMAIWAEEHPSGAHPRLAPTAQGED